MTVSLPLLRAALAAALVPAWAGCELVGRSDDVRARVDGGQLVVENRSGAAVHVHAAAPGATWLAASLPGNGVANGAVRRMRILPSQRGQVLELSWWRPGERIGGSEVKGADKIRRVRVDIPLPAQPLPDEDAFIVACTRAAALRQPHDPLGNKAASTRPLAAEARCAARADRECPLGSCALVVDHERKQLALLQAAVQPSPPPMPPAAPAAAAAPAPRQGMVEFARDALADLYGARLSEYTRRLCRGASSTGQMEVASVLGEALARKGAMPTRVVSRGTHEVVFGAGDVANGALNSRQVRVRFGNMTGERLCLASVDELGAGAVSTMRR